jgi:SET domain-containing protein
MQYYRSLTFQNLFCSYSTQITLSQQRPFNPSMTAFTTSISSLTQRPAYVVKQSRIHGNGVFARRKIPAGARIIEYRGERITWAEALRRAEIKGGPLNHTFYFSLSGGKVIDGGRRGNDARWINHGCEPNCEPLEEDGRVFIYALHDIARGEELRYHYALIFEERHTPAVKRAFACHCGAPDCTGSMLASKRRTKRKK